MNGYATGRQNGWFSANDIREMENMNPIPDEEGGNLYLINGAMTKLADAGAFARGRADGRGGENRAGNLRHRIREREADNETEVLELGKE